MTPTPEANAKTVPAPIVTPQADSRLEQLVAQFEDAKVAEAEATARLKTLKDAIKLELTKAHPDAERIVLRSKYLQLPYRLVTRSSWRIDSKALKRADPHIYVKYAYQTTAWYLEVDA